MPVPHAIKINTRARFPSIVIGTTAALALSLVPGAATAQTAPEVDRSAEQVSVRLKVADQPAVEVAVAPRAWPAELMEAYGVSVDDNDIVEVVRKGREVEGDAKRIRAGDTVRLVEVDKRRRTRTTPFRADVKEIATTKLSPGQRKVVRKGKAGLRRVVAVRTFHNDEPVKFRVVARKTLREAKPRRVLVGQEAHSVPGADGLNWSALAGCESGGNPRAVNPAGYYGLYQFDVGTWRGVGGSGMPHLASAGEQTYRAKLLYAQRGRSPWPNCGRLL